MANFNDDRVKLWTEKGYIELAEYLNQNKKVK